MVILNANGRHITLIFLYFLKNISALQKQKIRAFRLLNKYANTFCDVFLILIYSSDLEV